VLSSFLGALCGMVFAGPKRDTECTESTERTEYNLRVYFSVLSAFLGALCGMVFAGPKRDTECTESTEHIE
jgi:hypothetical protein